MNHLQKFWRFDLAVIINIVYLVLSIFCPVRFDYRIGHSLTIAIITLLLVLPHADHLFASATRFKLKANSEGVFLQVSREANQQALNKLNQAFSPLPTRNVVMSSTIPPTARTWECLRDVSERLLLKIAEITGYQEATLCQQSSTEILALASKRGTLNSEQLEALSGFYGTRDKLVEVAISAGGNTPSWVVDDAWRLQEIGEMVIQALSSRI